MKNQLQKFFTLLTITGLLTPFIIFADGPIAAPRSFYGTVRLNGNSVAAGLPVTAYCDSIENPISTAQKSTFVNETGSLYGTDTLPAPAINENILQISNCPSDKIVYFTLTVGGNELIANENSTAQLPNNQLDLTFTVSTAPIVPTVSDPAIAKTLNADNYTITGIAEAGSTVKIYRGIDVVGNQQLASDATTYSISVALTQDSVNNFTITATDAAGNESEAATVPAITEDSTAPVVVVISSDVSGPTNTSEVVLVHTNQTITLSASDRDGSGVAAIKYCTGEGCSPATNYSVPLTYTTSQDTIVRYQAIDNTGNASETQSFTLKIRKYDVNSNGMVDLADFSVMMSVWGKAANYSDNAFKSDLNANNKVDLADFSILMANWGKQN